MTTLAVTHTHAGTADSRPNSLSIYSLKRRFFKPLVRAQWPTIPICRAGNPPYFFMAVAKPTTASTLMMTSKGRGGATTVVNML
jgi:hypothetical protein